MLRSQSDERLVDLARAGNDRAFEAIVHRYRRPLLRYSARFLSGVRAEDAVQQTFLNAYRAMKADERAIDLRPWLYRIAHNAALNALRASGVGGPVSEEPLSEEIDGVERPDQAFERRQKLHDVVAAVQALPQRQRDAIVLHELEGRSYDQIASELKVSGGAVRQLLSRARTTLRAGATALVPEGVLVRLASGDGESVAARVAEIVTAGGGAAALAKVGTAVVIAGAVAAGASEGPLAVSHHESGSGDRSARQAVVLSTAGAGTSGARDPGTAAAARSARERRASGTSANPRGKRPRRGRGRGRGGDDATGDHANPGFIDDHGDDGHGGESEHSGPGGGGSGSDDDRSGSHGGSGDDGDRSGSNSGPGSGSDDTPLASQQPDSSGSGSGGSGSDHSGSGSGGGSGGGSDDAPLTVTTPDPVDDSSGSSRGSDDPR